MQKPKNTVMNIDDTEKGRKGIKEMLDRLFKTENSSEQKPLSSKKETA